MTQPTPPQISFTITMVPSITVAQFDTILGAIQAGLEAYRYLVTDVVSNHVSPMVTQTSIVITSAGLSPQDARDQVSAALSQLPAGTFKVQMADDPAAA